ncbi:MAG: DUF1552 domain-containing protein [Polyangiales bacterium]
MTRSGMRWSRRQVLSGLGASTLLAPFVPLLNVSGQEPVPRRLVLFYTPHGTVWQHWRPTGSGADFQLSRILAPLAGHKKKLVVLDGLGVRADGVGAPHTKGPALLWTASPLLDDGTFTREDCSGGCSFGWNTGPSFDQVLAQRLAGATPFPSYELGVACGGGSPGAHTIYAGPAMPVPPRQDPIAAWNELFSATLRPPEELKKLRARRKLALDLVNGELSSLESKVSRADLPKVQAHRESLSQLETQLLLPVPDCSTPTQPNAAQRPVDSADAMQWTMDRQLELLTAAFSCDLTRIASLQFRLGENDGNPYRFLGVNDEHHISTHDQSADKQEAITKIYTWYADRFAALLKKLDAIPEGQGTMLDHTLVVWGSELGTGWSHDFSNVPFVVAGGGEFGVQTGRYRTFEPGTTWHNRLIVSAMRFMGAGDVETFGTLDKESGSLTGLGV